MTLEQANKLVKLSAERMNARYKNVVFDEWAIIALARAKWRLLSYSGPRQEGFQKNFLADAGSGFRDLFGPATPLPAATNAIWPGQPNRRVTRQPRRARIAP